MTPRMENDLQKRMPKNVTGLTNLPNIPPRNWRNSHTWAAQPLGIYDEIRSALARLVDAEDSQTAEKHTHHKQNGHVVGSRRRSRAEELSPKKPLCEKQQTDEQPNGETAEAS